MTYRDDAYTRAASLPTLEAYNRGAPPLEGGLPSGVRCPACAATGEPVEMRIGLLDETYAKTYVAVACPRCLFSAYRRCTLAERDEYIRAAGHGDMLDGEEPSDAFDP